MQRIIGLTLAFIFTATLTTAQNVEKKIVLENGSSVNGTIVKENADYIFLDTGGEDVLKISKRNILEMSSLHSDSKTYDQPAKSQQVMKSDQSNRAFEDNYFTLGAGYGTSFGGFGMQMQLIFGQVGIHGGLGYYPASLISFETEFGDYSLDDSYLANIGFKVYFDKERKFFMDLQYGAFGVQGYQLNYYYKSSSASQQTTAQQATLKGPSLISGIDIFFSDHVGLNADLGVSYNTVEIDYLQDLQKYWFAADLGILIRF